MTSLHLFILLAALQVADIVTTLMFLKRPGLYERNPILRKLFELAPPWAVLVVSKTIFLALVHQAQPHMAHEHFLWALMFLNALYAVVVSNNILLLIRNPSSEAPMR